MTAYSDDQLLEILAEQEGMSVDEMLRSATFDSISPGICPECLYSTSVEPDSREGWCESCRLPLVKSCLVLAGII